MAIESLLAFDSVGAEVLPEERGSLDEDEKIRSILELFDETKEMLKKQFEEEEEKKRRLNPNREFDEAIYKFFDDMGWTHQYVRRKKKTPLFHFDALDKETGKLKSGLGNTDVEKEMEKSVLRQDSYTDTEKQYHVSQRKLKRIRQKEQAKTKGANWFDLPAPELTEELKTDLQVLKMRSVFDPKHFYKKNDMESLPKHFHVGTIMDSPLDHVNERVTKKQRKRTMVDELLEDAEFQRYNKKKYKEIIDEKRKSEYRTFMKDKRQKNKAEYKKNKKSKKA